MANVYNDTDPMPDDYPTCACKLTSRGFRVKNFQSKFCGKFIFKCGGDEDGAVRFCKFWQVWGDDTEPDLKGCRPIRCFCRKNMSVFLCQKEGPNNGKLFHKCRSKGCKAFFWEHRRPGFRAATVTPQ
jgi:hypothetical protein